MQKAIWEPFGVFVHLGPCHASVLLSVGQPQQKQKHDGCVKSAWALFAMLKCIQVFADRLLLAPCVLWVTTCLQVLV